MFIMFYPPLKYYVASKALTPRHVGLSTRLAGADVSILGFASSSSIDTHTCHILPPSEIDFGLCLAVFAGSGGKYLSHRIG